MAKWQDEINKKVGKNILLKGDQILDLPRIPTGSLSLDVETGGGIPIGKISTFAGDYMDGKTALALKVVANFQKLWPQKEVLWLDVEGVWDEAWAKCLGVDTKRIDLAYAEYSEQAFDIMSIAISNNVGLIVLDSIAALSPKSEAEADMETNFVGLQARLNKRWLRKAQGALLDKTIEVPPTVILINQLYANIGGYGPAQTEAGGGGLEYYPSLKIRLKAGDLYPKSKSVNDEGVEPKAQSIRFFTEKNKTAPRHRRGHVWFFFDNLDEYRKKGDFDRIEEVVRYATKFDLIQKRGSMYDLTDPETGEVRSERGSATIAEILRNDDGLRTRIEEKVMDIVNGGHEAVQERFEGEEQTDTEREAVVS